MASDAKVLPQGRDLSQLRWLGQQVQPMWGGPLDRGKKHTDPAIQRWLDAGWIGEVSQPCRGYVLTLAGAAAVAEADRLPPPPESRSADDLGIRWLQTAPSARTLQVRRDGMWIDVPTVRP